MTFKIWWAFTVGSALICGAPGPNMLHMLAYGARYGFRRTLPTMLGCFLAVGLMIASSVAGAGALLAASPRAFAALCYLGAAYLLYIGAKSCLSATPILAEPTVEEPRTLTQPESFRAGFAVGASNPKAFLFAIAFFPQFVDPSQPQIPQLAVLLATFAVIEFGCYIGYATGGSGMARFLAQPRTQRMFNVTVGLLFVGFGVLLLLYKMR